MDNIPDEINEDNIVNEDNEIVEVESLEKVFQVKECVWKIKFEVIVDGKKALRTGSGFFCIIQAINMKAFVTNNHVLDEEFLSKENKLKIFYGKNDKEKKEIDLDKTRFKYTNKKLDFTIIEILPEDNIQKYLELDEFIESEEYIDFQIFAFQFPKNGNLSYSHGKILKKTNKYFVYSLGTKGGSSGSPIILFNNLKVIALHKGKYTEEDKNLEFGLGIPFNLILNTIQNEKANKNVFIKDKIKNKDEIKNKENQKEVEKQKRDDVEKEKKDNKLLLDFNKLQKLDESSIEKCTKCICKIELGIKSKNEVNEYFGFFCNIQSKNIKALITNNCVLNEEYIYKEKKLFVLIAGEKKEINLKINRYKYTNRELDFTVLEILPEDNIKYYLELDENCISNEYFEEPIVSFGFSQDIKKLIFTHGKIIRKIDENFLFLLENKASFGSPIILINNLKVIGLYRNKFEKDEKFCLGIPMKLIKNKIDFIKCVFNIDKESVGHEVKILYKHGDVYDYKNSEIEKEIIILIDGEIKEGIFKYKFNKEGIYNIYYIQKNLLTNMSYMFYMCDRIEEIDFSAFNTEKVIEMNSLFDFCSSLKKINFSNFNTDKVIDMGGMFSHCNSLKELNLSNFNTDKVDH